MGMFKPNVGRLAKKKDIAGLAKALQYKKDWHVRATAATAMGDIGDARALEPLTAALKDRSDYVRAAAATALGAIGDARAVGPLASALDDMSNHVSEAAAQALARIGQPAANVLTELLEHGERAVRETAAATLAAMLKNKKIDATQVITRLIDLLKSLDGDMRNVAAHLLYFSEDARTVTPLIAALGDTETQVRETSAKALGKIGDSRAIAPLIEALKEPTVEVRKAAAGALVKIGDPAVEPLEKTLKDNAGAVGITVVSILNDLGWKPATKEQEAYVYAAKANWKKCVEIGTLSLKPLIAMLQDPDQDIRLSVIRTLSAIGDTRAVKPLCAMLQDASSSIRQASVQALKTIGDSRAVPPLLEAQKRAGDNSNWQESSQIKEILNSTEWKPETEELKAYRFIMKKDWKQCVKIGGPAVPLLISILPYKGENQYIAVMEALGEIGDLRAVKPLTPLMEDRNAEARKTAALALLSIAEKNPDSKIKNLVAREIKKGHRDTICEWSDECSSGSQHTDTGIKLDVKL